MNAQDLLNFENLFAYFKRLSGVRDYISMLKTMIMQNRITSTVILILFITYITCFFVLIDIVTHGFTEFVISCLFLFICGLAINITAKSLHRKVYRDNFFYDLDNHVGQPWLYFKTRDMFIKIRNENWSSENIDNVLFILNQKLNLSYAINQAANFSKAIGINFLFVCVGTLLAFWTKQPFQFFGWEIKLSDASVFEICFQIFAILDLILPGLLELRASKHKKMLEFKNSLLWINSYPELFETALEEQRRELLEAPEA
ncbi:MAG: hypothetical protein R6W92_06195 [Desulfocurvibacter africanus]